ncbi:MAG: DUF2490 domain-containing protein [Pseudomonadota bacterium]
MRTSCDDRSSHSAWQLLAPNLNIEEELDPRTEMTRIFFGTLLLIASELSLAVDHETQTWMTAQWFAKLGNGDDLGLRYRSRYTDAFDLHRLQQYQVTYARSIGDSSELRLGYEHFRGFDSTLENRAFPELHHRAELFGLPLKHRLRLEFRDLEATEDLVYRLRYQLSFTRPFGSAYWRVINEVFYTLSDEPPLLERKVTQNRLGGAVGKSVGRYGRIELGYQWAYFDGGISETSDHLIQLNLIWDAR